MGIRMLCFLIIFFFTLSTMVHAVTPLTAAFVRDHQLWLKKGDQEIQLTTGQNVSSPKWSYDGRFIAYVSGNEQGGDSKLFIYDTKKQESYLPYVTIDTTDFKWSPIKNQLAYTSGGVLNVTKTKNGRPEGFENVSLGVSDFAWFPNGKEFIVSSQANLLPSGWEDVRLYRVPIDAKLDTNKIEPFYTIQTDPDDLFAITAEFFKWSFDGKWVSFLAIPTASWSMDSNTLCVLSSEGKDFKPVGKMLWFEDWMKWAPSASQLAYISGEGRFFVENKRTSIVEMPASVQQKEYTPAGYVDLDLEWYSSNTVIVARAKENKMWEEGPVPTMFTSLFEIDLKSKKQKQISFPKKNQLDRDPQVVGPFLTWLRLTKKGDQGDVWVKNGLYNQAHLWIKDVDSAPIFFNDLKD